MLISDWSSNVCSSDLISPDNHAALLNHSVDAVVTTTDELDGIEGLESHAILTEPFVLVFPASYTGPSAPLEALAAMPFVRYSLRSAIGRQIEGQLNRLRRSEEHTSELQSLMRISYAVFR